MKELIEVLLVLGVFAFAMISIIMYSWIMVNIIKFIIKCIRIKFSKNKKE